MNKPNFLVVGAAKSGTTTLDGYLKQHPDVYLPSSKESRYFSGVKDKNINPFTKQKHADVIANYKDYYEQFIDAKTKAMGDISPDYLYFYEESIKKIKHELNDNVKIIIILRNPVQRAYSNYLHLIRDRLISDDLKTIIQLEENWNDDTWYGFNVIKSGYYYDAVDAYIKNFNNIKIVVFEDFISDTKAHLKDICDFLDIDRNFQFKEPSFKNRTGVPKNNILNFLLKKQFPFKIILKNIMFFCLGKNISKRYLQNLNEKNLIKPILSKELNDQILKKYDNDLRKLEKLLNRDLAFWK